MFHAPDFPIETGFEQCFPEALPCRETPMAPSCRDRQLVKTPKIQGCRAWSLPIFPKDTSETSFGIM
jgi:hypothetical protein